MADVGEIVLVACMKDEGPFILDWIGYHLSIGVGKFVILTNDCSDGTDLILDRLDELGAVRHLPNPVVIESYSKSIQTVALKYAALQKEVRSADWLLIIDADEFLNLMPGTGTIADLLAEVGEIDAISFNQVVFGNAGIEAFVDEPVPLQFNHRFNFQSVNPALYPMMFGIKTLVHSRSDVFGRFTNHLPRIKAGKEGTVRWLDGAGQPMHPGFLERGTRSYPVYMERQKDADNNATSLARKSYEGVGRTHALGYVNHYSLRSLESFVVQSRRGDAVDAEVRRDFGYWTSYNRNRTRDRSIHPKMRRALPLIAELKADPVLGRLHRIAVERHQAIFRQMSRSPAVRELMEQCRADISEFRSRMAPSPPDGEPQAATTWPSLS